MRKLVDERDLTDRFEIDSAGTGDWHVGKRSDPRAIEAAAVRGLDLTSRARQVAVDDFDEFDLLIAMDRSNYENLVALGESETKVHLLRQFGGDSELDVPDPYYGGDDGFTEVLDILERNCEALLDDLTSRKTP